MRLRFVILGLSLAVVLAGLGWWIFRTIDDSRFEADLRLAQRDLAAKRYERARQRLLGLESQRPARGDVEYALGACREALGDRAGAIAAWIRVPPDSAYRAQAALRTAKALLETHQFAEAETRLKEALRYPGSHSLEAWQTLAYLFKVEGRFEELRGLFRAHWQEMPNPVAGLQELWRIATYAYPVEEFRTKYVEAKQTAPHDARVWLGLVNQAVRSGNLGEAELLLKERPATNTDDPAVWRARLNWARAANRPDEAEATLGHVDPEQFDLAELHSLAAWFAASRGDLDGERQSLEQAVATAPGSYGALERLAEIAHTAGQADRVKELRQRKAEVDRARARYEAMLFGPDPMSHPAELMELADAAGQPFEALAWAVVARARDPSNSAPREFMAKREGHSSEAQRPATVLAAIRRDLARTQRTRRVTSVAGEPAPEVPPFADDAAVAGLQFRYDTGTTASRQLPVTMGGGVALLDYDADGWLDVYVTQGGEFPPATQPATAGDRLFRNRRDGTFEDATESSRISTLAGGYGLGVAAGDYDNDGFTDIFVTRWRSYALFRNRGDGSFEAATAAAGLAGDRDWPTSAAFADLDGDGDLDLYVCHYLTWDEEHPKICRQANGKVISCPPREFAPLPDHVFRNDDGRFVDVSTDSGMHETEGRGLGVVAADLNGDRKIDVFVANDMSANLLFYNRGGFHFDESAQTAGVASNADGLYKAGMGIACGDVDGDGLPDLAVGNFYGESATLYRNMGDGLFTDRSAASGLAAPTRYVLSFGMGFLDANNDGRLDLAVANGHLDDLRPAAPFEMPAQLFLGAARGSLVEAGPRAGAPFTVPRIGRGLASGDLDNDGGADFLVTANDGLLAYFHNRSTTESHWLIVDVVGTASGRDAVGAAVTVRSGGLRQVAQRIGGGSYQSASDPRLHFGLRTFARADSVEVAWPSGRVDRYTDVRADTMYVLREGAPAPIPSVGFASRSAAK